MKKYFSVVIFILASFSGFSQEIVNTILVGKNGITEDIKEARSFIIIKQYPNNFQRLDYNIGAPLERVRTYSDSNLTNLDGAYYEYSFGGAITLSGTYSNNTKEKDWHYFNDTGKIILTMQYENGIVIKTINPDTVKKELPPAALKDYEVEASFKKGEEGWRNYLRQNMNHKLAEKTEKTGRVRIAFAVDTTGKCVDIYLRRSAQFIYDEEAIRLIANSPLWKPAIQKGKKVKAYRIQPLTWLVEN